jgi:pSer/pThr/pTyr-binding forkhead associated (FHA) protein
VGYQLTISKGSQQGRELTFEQSELHIGRTPENDVVLQDTGVSRRHVRILERMGRYFVQDLGSSNGTLVNDAPITGERELANGDRLALGAAELVFKAGVSDEDSTRLLTPVQPDEDDATRPIRRNVAPPAPAAPSLPPITRSAPPVPELRVPARLEPSPSGPPVLFPVEPAPSPSPGTGSRKATMGQVPVPPPPPPEPQAPRRATVGQMPLPSVPPPVPPPEDKTQLPRRLTMGQMPVPPVPVPEAPLARPAPRAPAIVDDETTTRVVPRKSAPAAASAPSGMTAADKARRRRELGGTLGGQFTLWWSELSGLGKTALLTLACCFLAGTGAALKIVFAPPVDNQGANGPEPRMLGLQTLPDSFGLGEGVKWQQPDVKVFDFEFVSPTRAVAVLRYQASGIAKEEVSVSVNAVPVGFVPADTLNSAEREVQQILSPSVLKRNERNQLAFDNTRNPPGRDGWQVWNLRLEIIPVPEMPPEKLLETARDYVARARAFYEQREVGAPNLFRAWDNFRSAWITLEALDDKPELYQDVRYMLGQVAVDLDHKCGQLMLDFKRNIQFKDRKRAAAVLAGIKTHFPTAAHRCHNLAVEKANEYGL